MPRVRLTCSLFCLAASLAGYAAATKQDESDMAKIVSLEQRDAEAARVNDVDALVSLWTDDGVLMMPGSDPVIGKPAIRKVLETQKEQSTKIQTVVYTEDWTERRIDGDQGWEWGSISVTLQLPDGRRVSQKAFMVRILSRQSDGSWKFARAIGTPGPGAIR